MPPSRKNWKPVTYCLIPFLHQGDTGYLYPWGILWQWLHIQRECWYGRGQCRASSEHVHVFGEVSVLNVTFGKGFPGIANEYMFQFSSGVTPTVLNLPEGVKWIGSSVVRANRTYQVSILNNIAVMGGAL